MAIPFLDIKSVTPEDRLFALKVLHDSMNRRLATSLALLELGAIEYEIWMILRQNPGLKIELNVYRWI